MSVKQQGISPFDFADLLGRWPQEQKTSNDVAGELFQNFFQRSIRGEQASRTEPSTELGATSDSLGSLLERRDFLRSLNSLSDRSEPVLRLTELGDELFGFKMLGHLGQGAFARVFLAEQSSLAGRHVVLKVSDQSGTEPQTLAQLQHTNIVPIYSVHEDDAAGIRAVCMPYFGGNSLSQVLRTIFEETSHPTSGHVFLDSLSSLSQNVRNGVPQFVAHDTKTLSLLSSQSFYMACAWIVARLADGLQHAHDRGVLHRDIKPSNVLLAADGTPMLLDFNLAKDDNLPAAQVEATLGGTIAYMAPEHLRALGVRSQDAIRKVDHRSDIFGLGMVLFEMLTGHNPFEQSMSCSSTPLLLEAMAAERSRSIPSPRRLQNDICWGLESVVRKCLAPDQNQRYQRAADLAEDLDRLLTHQCLRFAPELNRREQFQKWLRRHPRMATTATITTAATVLLSLSGWALQGTTARLKAAQQRVAQTEAAEAQQIMQEFQRGTLKALCLINTQGDLKDHLAEGVAVSEKTLALYDIIGNERWQSHPAWLRLSTESQRDLAADARELLLMLAGAKMTLSQASDANSTSQTSSIQEAMTLLSRAESIPELPASAALLRSKAHAWRLLKDEPAALAAEQEALQLTPTTARDFYLLATSHLQADDPDRAARAIAELQRAVELDPRHYWSWMQKGLCHLERGEPQQALADFGVCIGLWPEFAWGHFNRGCTFEQIGDRASAIADFSAALQRDPDLHAALHNRGLAYLETGRLELALADFEQLVGVRSSDAVLHALRGQALEGLKRHDEADQSFEMSLANLNRLPLLRRHQLLCSYGFAISQRSPRRAEELFEQIPSDDPKHAEALYGLGMLAAQKELPERAIELFEKALLKRPTLLEARRFRAILLARAGQINEAIAEINTVLQSAPRSGAAMYSAACVTALAAEHAPGRDAARQAKAEALRLLQQALELGYGHHADSDSDLKAIHNHPDFERLMLMRQGSKSVARP